MGVWFASGVQRCLEFDVEGARSNATPVRWAANLHIVDRIKAEPADQKVRTAGNALPGFGGRQIRKLFGFGRMKVAPVPRTAAGREKAIES
jgi:hypothetical protein